MKLPADAIIAKPKVANYLLEWRRENDKSQFLAQAGYTSEHADQLTDDIRQQLLSLEAEFEESTEYGDNVSHRRRPHWAERPHGASGECLDDRGRDPNNQVSHVVPGEGDLT